MAELIRTGRTDIEQEPRPIVQHDYKMCGDDRHIFLVEGRRYKKYMVRKILRPFRKSLQLVAEDVGLNFEL